MDTRILFPATGNHIKDRRAAHKWARDVLADPTTVILDTETACLVPVTKEVTVIEIAIIDTSGAVLFNSRVKPTVGIGAGATAVHGIRDQDVADAPAFEDIFADLSRVLFERRRIVYNVEFDGGHLDQACWRTMRPGFALGKRPEGWIECAMHMYAAYCGQWSDFHQSYTWQPLPFKGHTALEDCNAVLRLLQMMSTTK